ncbi:unnamed protein product [Rangifer tarandus platyrhynchus]|uniref:Uncharacterized protein n=2 Tax=Rangifer tarandus platyrhynchus TaxID=3082113 RepID=A0AC60A4V2_RANTA|nr:unnamed protein product [Rangifer tarandus platyrhynchus]
MGKIEHRPCTQAPRRDPQLSSAHGCQWKLLRVRGLQVEVPGTPPVRKCKLLHVQPPLMGLRTHSAVPSLLPSEVGCSVHSKARSGLAQARPGCFCCGGAWVLNTNFQEQTPPPSSLSMAFRAAAHRSPGLSTRFCREMSLVRTCVFICSTGVRACVCVSQWAPFSSVACQPSLLWTQAPFMGSFLCQFFNSLSVSAHVLLFGANCGHKDFAYAPLCM